MGAAVDNGGRQMTQQRVEEGKEQYTGDKSEELQTLVPLIGLSPLFLQNQELRPPTLSSFHLLPGILTCLPTWVGDQENQWEGPEKEKKN